MSIKEYSPVLDEDYNKVAQLEYALGDDVYCENKTFEHLSAKNAINLNYKYPETAYIQVNKPDGLIGGTILHASLIYIECGNMESLIKNGADITIKNADGCTVVHLEVKTAYEGYLHSWKTEMEMSELLGTSFCQFTNSILSTHIDSNIATNPHDNNGISHFHIACMANNVDVVKFFLDKGISIHETVNQDSPILPGFTPLHFAAKYCAVEVVILLLKRGADVHLKDAKGMSSLHVLIDEKLKLFTQSLRAMCCNYKASETHYKNLRKYFDKNEILISLLLHQSSIDHVDSIGFTNLHAISTFTDTSTVEEFLEDNDVDDVDLNRSLSSNSSLCPGYTALHFAAHFDADMVKLLLANGADMSIKDARGSTAFDICLQNRSLEEIHDIFKLEPDLQSIKFSDAKTKLSSLIDAMRDPKTFPFFLKTKVKDIETFVPSNSPFCPGNTPLHFAAVCMEIPSIHWDPEYSDRPRKALWGDSSGAETEDYISRIQACLDLDADVTATNDRGFTPLHLAFRLQASRAVRLMSKYHKKTWNPIDVDGLSHLHIASAAKDHELVGKLLANGVNVNRTTNCGFTVRPYFVKSNSTPLHFAVVAKCPRVVKMLIDNGADVLARDAEGATPLERFFELLTFSGIRDMRWFHYTSYSPEDTEVVELLVRRTAAEVVDGKESPKRLLECLRIFEEELLKSIMRCNDVALKKIFDSIGITELHVACLLRDKERIVEGSNVNAQVDLDSPFWAGVTPLHVAMKYKDDEDDFVTMLLGRGADVTLRNASHDSPLHLAFNGYRNDPSQCRSFDSPKLAIVDAILACQKDFSVNPVDAGGTSHFHIACARNNLAAVNEFLQHGVDINQTTDYFDKGFTALHFAAHSLQTETIKALIKHGADVQRRATGGNSLLHTCFDIPLPNDQQLMMSMMSRREEALGILIEAGIDVNSANMFGETIFTLLMKTDLYSPKDILDYLKRGCHVDVYDVDGEGLMAAWLKRMKDFETYLTIFCDTAVRRIDDTGRNDIHNVVSLKRPWPLIPIEAAFVPIEDYIRAIEKLMHFESDIDKQDVHGSTPLHAAAKMQNIPGIVGLLTNGADVNVTDGKGKTALDWSFEIAANSEGPIRDLDKLILKAFGVHVSILKWFRLELSERVKEVLKKVQEQYWDPLYSIRITMSEGFLSEVASLEKRRIEPYAVTLLDFLSETGAVAAYPIMLEVQRHAVDEFFYAGNLWKSYPAMSGLLWLQYRKALARVKLIDPAMDSLRFLVGFDIPDVCSKVVLRFLANKELTNLALCSQE